MKLPLKVNARSLSGSWAGGMKYTAAWLGARPCCFNHNALFISIAWSNNMIWAWAF